MIYQHNLSQRGEDHPKHRVTCFTSDSVSAHIPHSKDRQTYLAEVYCVCKLNARSKVVPR